MKARYGNKKLLFARKLLLAAASAAVFSHGIVGCDSLKEEPVEQMPEPAAAAPQLAPEPAPRAAPPPPPPPPPPQAKNGGQKSRPALLNGDTPVIAQPPDKDLDSYEAKVQATERLEIPGPPGELTVWIGRTGTAPPTKAGMVSETKPDMGFGVTARITPHSLGIRVERVLPMEDDCYKLDPSGLQVPFRLVPEKTGTFKVGAYVQLFDSLGCKGSGIPKPVELVEVQVTVCESCVVKGGLGELGAKAWKAFLDFWAGLLAIFFALLLFLTRKKLYEWFGFKSEK